MIALLLVLVLQGPEPTVGDTVWVERVLGDVGGAVVRPQPWSLGELGEQLGPALVTQGARGAVVRYPLVFWYPGDHTLTMPGPVLVRRDGRSDTLKASTHKVSLSSVLPAGQPRSRLAPKPARGTLPIAAPSLVPLVITTGAVVLLLLPVALLWRRRGKVAPLPTRVEVFPDPARLREWAAAGEYRAALTGWSWRLARILARSQDLTRIAEAQRVLEELSDQVYLPGESTRLAELCERAARLDGEAA